MDIIKEMVDYRARNRLSQTELSELLGMTPNAIYKIENRKVKPRTTTVSKMQQLLDDEK